MADTGHVQQLTQSVSIPRNGLARIAQCADFSKLELRVIFTLFTRLNGYSEYTLTGRLRHEKSDPLNFIAIDKKAIAKELGCKKKEVEKVLYSLLDRGVLEMGSNEVSAGRGYRFTF